jgi:hypothetical protein
MERENIAIEIIVRLRKQKEFEDNCLAESLKVIHKKYTKILLSKYSELYCGVNHG